ncbi:hypothetical protein WMY93_010467 [Mugilogobius chulae]|uniref:Protein kinase domain-containing protein n=1 Tax=Mugilogobius chulae TaxID=88201 RepID=A0AAW0PDP6_9GOBI
MSTYGCGCAAQCKYKVLQLLGEGSCGKVAKGRNRYTKQLVALKVQKKGMHEDYFYKKELENLDLIRPLDPDTFNLIRFIEHFEFKSHRCLAFELLDQSVLEHLNKCDISLNQMRPMAKQLLVSLFGLKSVGLMHTDIKLDNIMLVDQEKQPFKLKLIDFGVAKHPSRLSLPEVVLGLPLGESVDMWSLACCLATCFKVGYVFPCASEFDLLTKIVKFLGKPPDELLNQAMYTNQYFVKEKSKWRLKTPQEYKKSSGENLRIVADELGNTTLQKLIKNTFRHNSCSEFTDREAFYDLLKRMFELDPLKRITPAEALLHPFITMEHLPPSEDYTQEAHDLMKVAQTDHVDLQTENLKKAAQCEEKKRAEALLSRPSAPPQPPLNQLFQTISIIRRSSGPDCASQQQQTGQSYHGGSESLESSEDLRDDREAESEASRSRLSSVSSSTAWAPTSDWALLWKSKLPLQTIMRLLQVLVPQVEKICIDKTGQRGSTAAQTIVQALRVRPGSNERDRECVKEPDNESRKNSPGGLTDETEILQFLQHGTLVGLLPVPHPILIRKYQANAGTTAWFRTYMWGVIYLR